MRVFTPKGLAVDIWHRYFRQYNIEIRKRGLWDDLQQTIAMVSLDVRGMGMKEAGVVIQKKFRFFLKTIGYSRHYGKRVCRESTMTTAWWNRFNKTGRSRRRGGKGNSPLKVLES